MRQLAEYLSGKGIATLRYDKVGTGKTGLGPYALRPAEVGSAVYDLGRQGRRPPPRGPAGHRQGAHLGLRARRGHRPRDVTGQRQRRRTRRRSTRSGSLQPLAGRYLDIITGRVRDRTRRRRRGGRQDARAGRRRADDVGRRRRARRGPSAPRPPSCPRGSARSSTLSNVGAVVEADAIDPLVSAAALPAGMPVLATCSDSDSQASCPAEQPLFDALAHTALTVVRTQGRQPRAARRPDRQRRQLRRSRTRCRLSW